MTRLCSVLFVAIMTAICSTLLLIHRLTIQESNYLIPIVGLVEASAAARDRLTTASESRSRTQPPLPKPACDPSVLHHVKRVRPSHNRGGDRNTSQHILLRAICEIDTRSSLQGIIKSTRPIVAILAATRSIPKWKTVNDSLLQQHLIPSLLSLPDHEIAQWDIRLYVAIDHDDAFWQNKQHWTNLRIPSHLTIHIHTFLHAPSHIPFNEIAKVAYDDGATYFCRMNDDSEFVSPPDWITMAVQGLRGFAPVPNLGVVGPTCINGNNKILTHDFVHRTHLQIFDGQYYPSEFDNCYVDDWITYVYSNETLGLGFRALQLKNWTVRHYIRPSRYKYKKEDAQLLPDLYARGLEQVRAYLLAEYPQYLSLLKQKVE